MITDSFNQLYPILTGFFILLSLILGIFLINSNNKARIITNKNNELDKLYLLIKNKYEEQEERLLETEKQKNILFDSLNKKELELATLKATNLTKEEALLEKISYLEKIKDEMTLKFKDISSEIIKTQHDTFTKSQQTTLAQILTPFSEQLNAFKTEVNQARTESIKSKSNLDAQLANLLNLNKTLSNDAQNLATALKGASKAQGNWGECQLSRILEISGLRKDQDYETQSSFTDENKKIYRPDVIIHLPENRDIIVDSKVSLNAYLDAMNTDDEIKRQKYLEQNLSDIKSHIDELSNKEYQKLLKERSLNYVIMFIPVESAKA